MLLALLASATSAAYEVREVTIPSKGMARAHQATVVLSDSYAESGQRYPVTYALHGWSGAHSNWTDKTAIEQQADRLQMILVMPDGAYDKWYVDSPVQRDFRYRTYIGREVVDFIDSHFRTIAAKGQRAITGLSMGGFGALNIALNTPDTFGAVGSISGAVGPRGHSSKFGLTDVFGDPQKNAAFWDRKTIANNAAALKASGMAITLDCGSDDFLIEANRQLHRTLLQAGVRHDYTERPGGHSWPYWDNAIDYQLLFFSRFFDGNK
ncbi:alpha/beta hydrolase family protein [Biformimicrobium ophioploci]|uniref:Alpha/beta hydrolase family protein n=1 Tax=Biformimicrobium ophioploci TaxID=3036711 RepID=A0ABQ6M0V8_9GAMM|nr:alpha/beta hydrolase family protein [Microbulbifer sp. NKW57]